MNKNTEYFNRIFPDQRHSGETDLQKAHCVMLRMLKIFDHICTKYQLRYWLEAGTLLGAIRHQGFIPWDDDLDVSMPRADYNRFIEIAEQELPADIFLQMAHTEKYYFNPGCPLKLRDKNSLFIELGEHKDSRVHQGIFIDIFPYDIAPDNINEYTAHKKKTKKLLKIKRAKILDYKVSANHYKYKLLGLFHSLDSIDQQIASIIQTMNQRTTGHLGYGYDFTSPMMIFPRESIFPLTRKQFVDAQFSVPGDFDRFLTIKFGDYQQLLPESERVARHTQQLIPDLGITRS